MPALSTEQSEQSDQGERPIWIIGRGWASGKRPAGYASQPRALIIAIVLAVLLLCAASVYLNTSSGQNFQHNLQTRSAKQK